LVPAEESGAESDSGLASAASRPNGDAKRLACGVGGLGFARNEAGANRGDPEIHCAEGMAPMYIGPQQGQFWQHVLEAFFLRGQCSWMNCFKHFNLRQSISVYFPGFQSHFLVFVG